MQPVATQMEDIAERCGKSAEGRSNGAVRGGEGRAGGGRLGACLTQFQVRGSHD